VVRGDAAAMTLGVDAEVGARVGADATRDDEVTRIPRPCGLATVSRYGVRPQLGIALDHANSVPHRDSAPPPGPGDPIGPSTDSSHSARSSDPPARYGKDADDDTDSLSLDSIVKTSILVITLTWLTRRWSRRCTDGVRA
jgi:hypothetical protein